MRCVTLNSALNHGEAVDIINAKHWILSAQRAGYHQAAGRYTLTRDEIQGRHAALDDIHHASRGDDMPSLWLAPAAWIKKFSFFEREFFGLPDRI